MTFEQLSNFLRNMPQEPKWLYDEAVDVIEYVTKIKREYEKQKEQIKSLQRGAKHRAKRNLNYREFAKQERTRLKKELHLANKKVNDVNVEKGELRKKIYELKIKRSFTDG